MELNENLRIFKCLNNFDGVISSLDNFYRIILLLVSLCCVVLCPRKYLS